MIDEWLKTLGLHDICQWDVLVFLHRHQSALVPAEQIARLLGYDAGEVVRALDKLESAGLLKRSRLDQGARWHSLAGMDGPGGPPLEELFKAAQTRAGRLEILSALRRSRPPQARSAITILKKSGAGPMRVIRNSEGRRAYLPPQRRKSG